MKKSAVNKQYLLICALLIIATVIAYWQVWSLGFVHLDDGVYVTENKNIANGLTVDSIIWAFTATCGGNWHPLTCISHALDCHLYKLDPAGHHLTSFMFHLANTLLLFLLMNRLFGYRWRSAFVAALFALHPLHVESVAWVAERKDVLSAFFWFLTTLAYLSYVKSPQLKKYLLVVAFFVMGLMSKPMLVTLPLTLLLLDFWPLNRMQVSKPRLNILKHPLFIEKLPLFIIAIIMCVVTFVVQRVTGAVGSVEIYSVGVRIANAIVSYMAYVREMFWPVGLACLYPHKGSSLSMLEVVLSAVNIAGVTFVAIREARTKPYLTVGWLWYLITLVPVIGLVQVGRQAMADRYTYVPLIGLFIILAWGIPDIMLGRANGENITRRAARIGFIAVIATAIIAILMLLTYKQVGYWRNDITLWTHTLSVTKRNAKGHYNLGARLDALGDNEGAKKHFEEALRIDPRKYEAHSNLGIILYMEGKKDEALAHFRAAIEIKPESAECQCNLASALLESGEVEEAIAHYEISLRLRPDDNIRAMLDSIKSVRQKAQ